jgi:hypothetical protein
LNIQEKRNLYNEIIYRHGEKEAGPAETAGPDVQG